MTDPIETTLLPCPFCDGAPVTFMWNGARQAMCPDKAGMCLASGNYAPVPIWNTRAASQADTARAEGIALGLALAKAAPRFVPSQSWIAGEPFREAVWAADIPEPPIPPHVAAARVLLERGGPGIFGMFQDRALPTSWSEIDLLARDWLEQIAKEGE